MHRQVLVSELAVATLSKVSLPQLSEMHLHNPLPIPPPIPAVESFLLAVVCRVGVLKGYFVCTLRLKVEFQQNSRKKRKFRLQSNYMREQLPRRLHICP